MFKIIITVILSLVLTTATMAELTPAIIKQCKDATAMVDNGDGRVGTAFCIDKAGYFVTHDRVVFNVGKQIKLILKPGEKDQAIVYATKVDGFSDYNLTILKVNSDIKLTSLEIDEISTLSETMPVTAFGYPFGKILSLKEGEYPAITVSQGHITSFKELYNRLMGIQIDASLNPGNAGGPLINDKGKVVGIADFGLQESTGINFAIPSIAIRRIINKTQINFVPPPISTEKQNLLTDFNMTVDPVIAANDQMTVEFTLITGINTRRVFIAEKTDYNKYHVNAIPVPTIEGVKTVRLSVTANETFFNCQVKNYNLKCDGKDIPLDTIRNITIGPPSVITLTDNTTITGPITGLENVEATMGQVNANINLTKSKTISVYDSNPKTTRVGYSIEAKINDVTVGQNSGDIQLITTTQSGNQTQQEDDKDKVTIPMPGKIDNIIKAGGGRYLILSFTGVQKLAVFDVYECRITKYLDLPKEKTIFAAGKDKLVLYLTEKKVLERYSLKTMEKENTCALPKNIVIHKIAMGCNSNGPVIAAIMINDAVYNIYFYDLTTLTKQNITTDNSSYDTRFIPNYSVSEDGKTVCIWNKEKSRDVIYVGSLFGNYFNTNYVQIPAEESMPGKDYSYIYTKIGVLNSDLEIASQTVQNTICLPANGGEFFMSIRNKAIYIYRASDFTLLYASKEIPEVNFAPVTGYKQPDLASLSVGQSVYFYPNANLLITIPVTRDGIVLRNVDIISEMDNAKIPYCYVNSQPVAKFKKGEIYTYQLQIKTNQKNITYKIESVPDGMTISKTGLIEWPVPENYASKVETIILVISDDNDKSFYHTFKITAD